MSITWGPHTKAAAERQAAAIRAVATEKRHHKLADRADSGEFTDYADTHACPITELYRLCRQYGLSELAARAAERGGDSDRGTRQGIARFIGVQNSSSPRFSLGRVRT